MTKFQTCSKYQFKFHTADSITYQVLAKHAKYRCLLPRKVKVRQLRYVDTGKKAFGMYFVMHDEFGRSYLLNYRERAPASHPHPARPKSEATIRGINIQGKSVQVPPSEMYLFISVMTRLKMNAKIHMAVKQWRCQTGVRYRTTVRRDKYRCNINIQVEKQRVATNQWMNWRGIPSRMIQRHKMLFSINKFDWKLLLTNCYRNQSSRKGVLRSFGTMKTF